MKKKKKRQGSCNWKWPIKLGRSTVWDLEATTLMITEFMPMLFLCNPHIKMSTYTAAIVVLLSPGLSEKYEFGMKFSFLLWKRKLLPPSDVLVLFLIYCISSTCLGSPSPVCCCLKAERSLLQHFPGQGEVFTSLSVVGRKSPQSA